MSATVLTVGLHGLKPYLVRVTATKAGGSFAINGIHENWCRETRVRVRCALQSVGVTDDDLSGVTVNIEPTPSGPIDLAIAVSVLTLLGRCSQAGAALIIGELDLNGNVRGVRGVLPMLSVGEYNAVVPRVNVAEATWSDNVVWTVDHLRDCLDDGVAAPTSRAIPAPPTYADIADVSCPSTRRVLEIAAAGRHSVLFVGPRGSGAMLAAKALTGILPPMTHEESLTVTSIQSVAGLLKGGLVTQRPFRAPHHTVSAVAMVGGGSPPRPGEASLAHLGVLFLGDMQDCRASVLEALADVLRAGHFAISRQGDRHEFPAVPLLVGHVWPCPCGEQLCKCRPESVKAYHKRLQSMGIWQRFDMRVRLREPSSRGQESSAEVQARVVATRNIQRFGWSEDVPLSLLENKRAAKVAQSVAATTGASVIGPSHVAEAISYAMPWPE